MVTSKRTDVSTAYSQLCPMSSQQTACTVVAAVWRGLGAMAGSPQHHLLAGTHGHFDELASWLQMDVVLGLWPPLWTLGTPGHYRNLICHDSGDGRGSTHIPPIMCFRRSLRRGSQPEL